MEVSEVLKLIDAGFTADDIRAMNNPDQQNGGDNGAEGEQSNEAQGEQSNEAQGKPKDEPAGEPSNNSEVESLKSEISNLKKIIAKEKIISNAVQTNDKKEMSAEDVLLSLLRY